MSDKYSSGCEVRLGVTGSEARSSASTPEGSPEEHCNIRRHRQKNVKLRDDARLATTKRYRGLSRAGFSCGSPKRFAANLDRETMCVPLKCVTSEVDEPYTFLRRHVPSETILFGLPRGPGRQRLKSPLLAPTEPDPSAGIIRPRRPRPHTGFPGPTQPDPSGRDHLG